MSVVTQVTFSTNFFQAIADEELYTNQGRLGKSLALWLAEQLRIRQIAVVEVIPEDFGWIIILSRQPIFYWIGCGNVDDELREWTVFLVVEKSIFQRLMRRTLSFADQQFLVYQLKEILTKIPNVSKINWE